MSVKKDKMQNYLLHFGPLGNSAGVYEIVRTRSSIYLNELLKSGKIYVLVSVSVKNHNENCKKVEENVDLHYFNNFSFDA